MKNEEMRVFESILQATTRVCKALHRGAERFLEQSVLSKTRRIHLSRSFHNPHNPAGSQTAKQPFFRGANAQRQAGRRSFAA